MVTKNGVQKRLGIGLSGGGYRAAAFHLGSFRKLHQLNLLDKVDVISTISGGSITGAAYALHKGDFTAFETDFTKKLKTSVKRDMKLNWRLWLRGALFLVFILGIGWLSFTYTSWGVWPPVIALLLSVIVIFYFQFLFLPFTEYKISAYEKLFFGGKKLKDLPDAPVLAINAANLETGTLFTFSKGKMDDAGYSNGTKKIFSGSDFPIARAVASSTCVPVPFTPVKIGKEYFIDKADFNCYSPALSDGGLYDNQGMHKLTEEKSSYACDIVLCSDGSQPFTRKFKRFNSFFVLYRSTDIMMRKIKSLQFIRDVYSKKLEIAYYSLNWEYDTCVKGLINNIKKDQVSDEVLAYHKLPYELLEDIDVNFAQLVELVKTNIGYDRIVVRGLESDQISDISIIDTDLIALTDVEIELLSRHAEVLTELQIKLYCPSMA